MHVQMLKLTFFWLPKQINVDRRNVRGESALMIACRHGHQNTTLFLLKNGADPNQRSDNGHTAVHEACRLWCASRTTELTSSPQEMSLASKSSLWTWITISLRTNRSYAFTFETKDPSTNFLLFLAFKTLNTYRSGFSCYTVNWEFLGVFSEAFLFRNLGVLMA